MNWYYRDAYLKPKANDAYLERQAEREQWYSSCDAGITWKLMRTLLQSEITMSSSSVFSLSSNVMKKKQKTITTSEPILSPFTTSISAQLISSSYGISERCQDMFEGMKMSIASKEKEQLTTNEFPNGKKKSTRRNVTKYLQFGIILNDLVVPSLTTPISMLSKAQAKDRIILNKLQSSLMEFASSIVLHQVAIEWSSQRSHGNIACITFMCLLLSIFLHVSTYFDRWVLWSTTSRNEGKCNRVSIWQL
jgi:hypothetical protein